ncbi:MAG: radical SAM protein [Deltaproteobacteria bacterium]|nr:MAG: radical SAM protein [Deltaproteobacteria bacterium]
MALIIPYFIPHQGCPHTCLFCNQTSITGTGKAGTARDIAPEIERWLPRKKANEKAELAFYGGSFTCLPASVQERYLRQVMPYIEGGEVSSIRLSTRPDCLSHDICRMLKKYRVKTVELGLQSMDDAVLCAAARGHSSQHGRNALTLLKKYGFQTGVQLLPGLPLETRASFIKGVKEIASLAPDMVRLYPAVVLKNSGLENEYKANRYRPLSLAQAVVWSLRAKEILEEKNIRVIRIGLQHSDDLAENYVAGPHHPAMGELVEARRWFKRARSALAACPDGKKLAAVISHRDLSAFNGPKKYNLTRLARLNLIDKLQLTVDKTMKRGNFKYVVC